MNTYQGTPTCTLPLLLKRSLLCVFLGMLLSGCVAVKKVKIEGVFPIPVMPKTPIHLGIHLDDELLNYTHKESIDKYGDWEISIGPVQQALFTNLSHGVFQEFTMVKENASAEVDGVLKPNISEVQLSLPNQTRSNYYEVWIRYKFELFDRSGNLVGDWVLPAYGKSNKNNYGSSSKGLQAAAIAASRDAMAFFSINFAREPVVAKWLGAGMPLVPAKIVPAKKIPAKIDPAKTVPAEVLATEQNSKQQDSVQENSIPTPSLGTPPKTDGKQTDTPQTGEDSA